MTAFSQPTSSQPVPSQPKFTVLCEDRWQVYYRLQELNIDAQCQGFRPLQVSIDTATEAIQLWSIVKRIATPRPVLAAALDKRLRDQPCTHHPLEQKPQTKSPRKKA